MLGLSRSMDSKTHSSCSIGLNSTLLARDAARKRVRRYAKRSLCGAPYRQAIHAFPKNPPTIGKRSGMPLGETSAFGEARSVEAA